MIKRDIGVTNLIIINVLLVILTSFSTKYHCIIFDYNTLNHI
jgi:hypothetical protein